jgi:predicted transcriptional regulator
MTNNEKEDLPDFEDMEVIAEYYLEKMPDWMTGTDLQILAALMTGLILSPSIIATNTGRSREGISRRLNTLQAADYVKKVDRGKYKITEEGYEFMEGRAIPHLEDWNLEDWDIGSGNSE